MYTNVSENVQPGTIVTFIDVGNILFKRLFISSKQQKPLVISS
jgi:hypothetical protein